MFRALIWVISFAALAVLFVFSCGRRYAVEWSPDRFQHRNVEWYVVPIIEMRVTPYSYVEYLSPLERYLHESKLIVARQPDKVSWLHVSGTTSGISQYDAGLWLFENELYDRSKCESLIRWSKDHPDASIPFWQRLHEAAIARQFAEAVPILVVLPNVTPRMDVDLWEALKLLTSVH